MRKTAGLLIIGASLATAHAVPSLEVITRQYQYAISVELTATGVGADVLFGLDSSPLFGGLPGLNTVKYSASNTVGVDFPTAFPWFAVGSHTAYYEFNGEIISAPYTVTHVAEYIDPAVNGPSVFGPIIDEVTTQSTPAGEPSVPDAGGTALLLGLALAGLRFVSRR